MAKIVKAPTPALYKTATKQSKEKNDCSVIALAIASDQDYKAVHAALKAAGRKDGQPICDLLPPKTCFICSAHGNSATAIRSFSDTASGTRCVTSRCRTSGDR